MTLFDRILGRRPARRSFDAATGAPRASVFRAFGATGPETLAAAGPVRSRARHAAANNGFISNGVGAIVAEAIGAGIEATSAHPVADLRPTLDAHWLRFARDADAEGRTDLRGLLAAMVRACVVDGEAFALIEDGPDGPRLRLLPAEQVDESATRDLGNGGYVVAGVEFDASGRRVAYHVQPHRPTDHFPTSGAAIRVPAENVLHLMRPLGPGQVRGVSWLAPVLLTLAELDALLDALIVGAKVSALHAGFVTDPQGLGTSPFPDASGDVADLSLQPGTVRVLPPGTDIKFSAPDQARDSVAFARLTLDQIAAGLGVPRHLLDGDLTGRTIRASGRGCCPSGRRSSSSSITPSFRRFSTPCGAAWSPMATPRDRSTCPTSTRQWRSNG